MQVETMRARVMRQAQAKQVKSKACAKREDVVNRMIKKEGVRKAILSDKRDHNRREIIFRYRERHRQSKPWTRMFQVKKKLIPRIEGEDPDGEVGTKLNIIRKKENIPHALQILFPASSLLHNGVVLVSQLKQLSAPTNCVVRFRCCWPGFC